MRGMRAASCARAMTIAAGLALSGCHQVDDALFGAAPGGSTPQVLPANAPASLPAPPPPPPSAQSEAPPPEAAPAPAGDLGPRVAAIAIANGTDTGTPVGRTAEGLRDQVRELQSRLMANARKLGQIRGSDQGLTASYQKTRSDIESRLAAGATPGNSQLVEKWNAAQSDLDKLATNLNDTASIGNAASTDSAAAQKLVQQINDASNTPGAVDEDHRQLDTLEDETQQIKISIDRLRKDVAADVPRQTGFLTAQRSALVQLQTAIRTGQMAKAAPMAAPQAPASASSDQSTPIAVIKFDQPKADYQKTLFAALSDALKAKPQARFEVLGVAPTADTVAAMQAAQTAARKHASEVVQTMTSMGVPAARMVVASKTDPSVQAGEVRVFAR